MKNIKTKLTKRNIIGIILILISLLIIASVFWANRTFSVQSLSQIIFHLKVPIEGTDSGIYWSWFWWCVPTSVVATFIGTVMLFNVSYLKKYFHTFASALEKIIDRFFVLFSAFCLVISLGFTIINYDVYGYFNNIIQTTDIYENYYVDPSNVEITFPAKKRNIVHIYLESMESTYVDSSNGGAMQHNYIPELEKLALQNTNFSNTETIGGSKTIIGTQWTIGAMVAQSAGIPLSLPIEGNSYSGNTKFLPGSHTIGQILQENGYTNTIMMGSKSDFAGTSNFYKQHGEYQIFDYDAAKKQERIPKDYYEFWGFEDKKLFQFAKEDMLQLSKNEQPFNMELITIDAHTPDGYLCDMCPTIYSSQYENVLACQSKQVEEFVSWLSQQDFYENTTIIITGDHNSMSTSFFEGINPEYIRTPYNVIINAVVSTENTKNRQFSTMDWYPTILAAMGATIEGERLGLGTNLFSDRLTLIEEIGFDVLNAEVQKTSTFYNKKIIGIKP